jgi:hypothetical protein
MVKMAGMGMVPSPAVDPEGKKAAAVADAQTNAHTIRARRHNRQQPRHNDRSEKCYLCSLVHVPTFLTPASGLSALQMRLSAC